MSQSAELSHIIPQRLDDLVFGGLPECNSVSTGLLIALSGGPDSVALLRSAHIWAEKGNHQLMAAHLNHRLRGSQADADAQFCQSLCDQLNIQLIVREEDPRPLARSRGCGMEEAARTLRHGFFKAVLADNPQFGYVATGHHLNDQVETVIMRLFRGTGPDGMAGIRPVSGNVIHPMLDTPRADILAWLEKINQPWRTDPTNAHGDNTRSRLRRELLPVIRSIFGDGAGVTPARLAKLWEGDLDFLETTCQNALSELVDKKNTLSISGLQEQHPALAARILRFWLMENYLADPNRLESAHLMNILQWMREGTSGSQLDLPGGGHLKRDFDRLAGHKPGQKVHPVRNAANFRILVAKAESPENPTEFGRTEGFGSKSENNIWNLTCPSGVLKGNLKVRNWQQGDRIQPFGLDGSRKLSDLFREQKIPADERSGMLVVEDDEGILWIVGLARAERTRLLQPGQSTVTISVAPRTASKN
ncbi:MAG: tRNA lysidine(34) synthetase TilS [bacterium]|nr:tRNA lysidine(34) synthetase TilS [bacterium]